LEEKSQQQNGKVANGTSSNGLVKRKVTASNGSNGQRLANGGKPSLSDAMCIQQHYYDSL
jgi:hypothetical protein